MVNQHTVLRGARLLVVDDMPQNLDLMCQTLESVGCEVLVAITGERALETARRQVPELILLDALLPGIDGFETCRRLKQESATQAIPIIFLTALDEVEHLAAGFAAGDADYITKPFRKEEVLLRVEVHLERARLKADRATPPLLPELPLDLAQALELAEEELVCRALAQSGDNVSAAACLLGTNQLHLYRVLERIQPPSSS